MCVEEAETVCIIGFVTLISGSGIRAGFKLSGRKGTRMSDVNKVCGGPSSDGKMIEDSKGEKARSERAIAVLKLAFARGPSWRSLVAWKFDPLRAVMVLC